MVNRSTGLSIKTSVPLIYIITARCSCFKNILNEAGIIKRSTFQSGHLIQFAVHVHKHNIQHKMAIEGRHCEFVVLYGASLMGKSLANLTTGNRFPSNLSSQ